ncbi:hypothetical protein GQ457_05G028400 [Hibiscus cannabinus]
MGLYSHFKTILIEVEMRKHDRVKRRTKTKSKENERKWTDFDIQSRWKALLEEATKALAIGKVVGIEIIQDEAEAVEELVSLVEKDQQIKENNCDMVMLQVRKNEIFTENDAEKLWYEMANFNPWQQLHKESQEVCKLSGKK